MVAVCYGFSGPFSLMIYKRHVSPPESKMISGQLRQIGGTSARVKSYQLLKVVSGGRAPGKSSSLASPQLLVIERFHCFGAVRLEKVYVLFFVLR